MPELAGFGMEGRVQQIVVILGHGKPRLLQFDGVDDDAGFPRLDPDPVRRIGAVAEDRLHLLQIPGRVGFEHSRFGGGDEAGGGETPDDVGLRVVLLRQQFRRNDAGGVADDFHVDVRVLLFEQFKVAGVLVVLKRGVDDDAFAGDGGGGDGAGDEGDDDVGPQ